MGQTGDIEEEHKDSLTVLIYLKHKCWSLVGRSNVTLINC